MIKVLLVAVALAASGPAFAEQAPPPPEQDGFVDPLPRPLSDMEKERGRPTGVEDQSGAS